MEERIKQREEIKRLTAETTLSTSEPAYLLSSEWFLTFKDIICYDEDCDPTSEEIPEIDNSKLLNNGKLKNNLTENQEFVIITKGVYDALKSYYGGGPDVTAKVVFNPIKKQNVVVYRKITIFIIFEKEKKEFVTTQYHPVSSIKQKSMDAFSINSDDVVLCEYFNNEIGEVLDDNKLLVEYSITDGQTLVLLPKDGVDKIKEKTKTELVPVGRVKSANGGICGLQNLGNTCFFNSAVQCLMHTDMLTDYFLDTDWTVDISKTNPLGTKGVLATAYYRLLQAVYSGKYRHVAPGEMRKTLIKFAPNFDSYSQQDAQELLLFLLDGIHEDLNRIKSKPVIDNVEGDGTNDVETAKIAWERHKMRNDSIVVDLFHGQLKSHLKCPDCNGETVVFDPYASVSLPVPQKAKRTPKFYFIPADNLQPIKEMSFIVKSMWSSANTKKYINTVENRQVDFIFATVEKNSTDIMFYGYPALPSWSKKLVICEFPSREKLYCPVFLKVPKKGFLWDSEIVISCPYMMPVPHIYSTEEDIQKSAEEFFAFLWDKDNPEPPAICEKFELLRKDWRPFKDSDKRMKVKIETSFGDNKVFTPFKRIPWLTKRTVSVTINPKYMKSDYSFKWSRFIRQTVQEEEKEGTQEDVTTLERCISSFADNMVLDEDNKWYCPKCKNFVCASKKMDIWSAPENLILHLKRFSQVGTSYHKTDVYVDYPLEFDFAPFIVGPHNETEKYKLYAVVEHHGGMGFGHYTAHAMVNNKWYFFNDSSVSEASPKEAKTAAGYVLFYKKIHK